MDEKLRKENQAINNFNAQVSIILYSYYCAYIPSLPTVIYASSNNFKDFMSSFQEVGSSLNIDI